MLYLKDFLFEELYRPDQKISGTELKRMFNYFHLSSQFLGDQFTFTPRIPRCPMQFEDNFTPRVSLGKTIKNCQKALEDLRAIGTFVYAGDKKKDPSDDFLTVSIKKETESNELYGFVKKKTSLDPFLDMRGWLEHRWPSLTPEEKKIIFDIWGYKSNPPYKNFFKVEDGFISGCEYSDPAHMPEFLKKKFKFFVPDAPKTNEYWTLEPVTMYLMGKIMIECSDEIRLTSFAAKMLNKT